MRFRLAPARPPAVAAEAMVATSQPLATRAGLRALEQGGNAVDAGLAAAAVLCVTEPMSTGIGGDAFALLWKDGRLTASTPRGPRREAPSRWHPVEERGPRSVTVPGAVAGWAALAERFGRFGLDAASRRCDRRGRATAFAVGRPITADVVGGPAEPAPSAGRACPPPRARRDTPPDRDGGPRRLLPRASRHARSPPARGSRRRISPAYEPRWVEPLTVDYRGTTVAELPPPTQGVAALEGLGLLALGEPTLEAQVECAALALADALAHVRDGADVSRLLEEDYLRERRRRAAGALAGLRGGTVYLCAVDGDGTALSFIQSLYEGFGSGVVAPGTGIYLQNRGACFAVGGAVEPGRRPYHTIIPGMLLRDERLLGPFGVMGGFVQAQAHLQLVSGLVDDGLDPQAALDRPRFRVDGETVLLEEGLWERADELAAAGLRPVPSEERGPFGGGQAILVEGDVLVGGSDARKDGYAAGF